MTSTHQQLLTACAETLVADAFAIGIMSSNPVLRGAPEEDEEEDEEDASAAAARTPRISFSPSEADRKSVV